jgi:hypothetical protein
VTGSPSNLKHSGLTGKILRIYYNVYNELGHGFLESTYSAAMLLALEEVNLRAKRQASVPVYFRGRKIGQHYADLVVEKRHHPGSKSRARPRSGSRSAAFALPSRNRHLKLGFC